jgi:hypothetical protein
MELRAASKNHQIGGLPEVTSPKPLNVSLTASVGPTLTEPTAMPDRHDMAISEEIAGTEAALMGLDRAGAADLAASLDPLSDMGSSLSKELCASPAEFIRIFAQINIVASEHSLEKTAYTITGNSRADPVRFKYKCPNAVYGCEATSYTTQSRTEHIRFCTLTSDEAYQAHVKEQNQRTFKCTWEGCTSSKKTQAELNAHVREVHNRPQWIRKVCEHGCEPDKLYRSETAYQNHQRDAHGSYTRQSCSYPGCTHSKVFDKSNSLRKRMKTQHNVKGAAVNEYLS